MILDAATPAAADPDRSTVDDDEDRGDAAAEDLDPAAVMLDLRELRRPDGRAQVQAHLPLRLLPVLLRLLLNPRRRATRPGAAALG